MRPTLSILDRRFAYTNAINTDIRKGRERVKRGLPYNEPKQTPSHLALFAERRKKNG